MTQDEILQKRKDLIALIKKWPKRLEKLRTRKDDPLKESEFCRRHGFETTHFNKVKNLAHLPRQKNVDAIEAAFKKENV